MGAFIIRIGFGGILYTTPIIWNPQNPIFITGLVRLRLGVLPSPSQGVVVKAFKGILKGFYKGSRAGSILGAVIIRGLPGRITGFPSFLQRFTGRHCRLP